MAEVEDILTSDSLLTQCFNQYLSLPVFPVHFEVHCNELKILVATKSSSGVLLQYYHKNKVPQLYHLFMEWLRDVCWPFFLKSQLYCKYRLCCCLQDQMSRHNKSGCLDFIEYLHFEKCMQITLAAPLTQLWVCCEANLIGVKKIWAQLHTLRLLCTTIPFLSDVASGSGERWMHFLQNQILQRLKFYWMPRLSQSIHSNIDPHNSSIIDDCFRRLDPYRMWEDNETFYDSLVCNLYSGDPFFSFISRHGSIRNCRELLLWQETHTLLTQFPAEKLQKNYEKLWSMYFAPGGEHFVEVSTILSETLRIALLWKHMDTAKNVLQQIRDDVFFSLKRLWTKYQKEMYSNYMSCFGKGEMQNEGNKQSSFCTNARQICKKKIDPKVLLPSDIKESVFNSLGDVEMFLQFEQFVFTTRGPFSEENTLLKLWKAINRYKKTIQTEKRDSLAISIHKAFISDQSRSSVVLPKDLMDCLDPDIPHDRPKTAALKKLQSFAEASLQPLIDFFLDVRGILRGSLSGIERTKLALASKKVCSHQQLQEDALHLNKTLEFCEGPRTHKLIAFSEYLSCNGTQQGLSNNVQFWLEVKKFKTMYRSETSALILLHKGEALVDRYLDAATPPWVKISVSSELANQVISAVEELHRYRNQAFLDRLMDLLEHAQHKVFTDMTPYWGSFCKQYQSPIESTVSLPQVVDCGPVTSIQCSARISQVNLPPLAKPRTNLVPLLSYSKLKGIKWRGALNF